MVNGLYRPSYLNDLGCCGCQGPTATDTSTGGFDFSSIPTWAWIAAAVVGGFLILKKK